MKKANENAYHFAENNNVMLYNDGFIIELRTLTGKKHPKIKLQRLRKYEYRHLGCWYIKLTLAGSKTRPNFAKK